MGRSPGAGDNHLDAPLCGLAGVLRCPVGRAVRRSNVNLVSDPKIVETLARLLHDLEIGVTAHDNRNHRFVHRFLTPDNSTRSAGFEPRLSTRAARKVDTPRCQNSRHPSALTRHRVLVYFLRARAPISLRKYAPSNPIRPTASYARLTAVFKSPARAVTASTRPPAVK